ncbi:MAG: hypothetical protein EOP09_05650 [Proteobacteria bacterium]|nr:MAG: hypothetical protein EOP09_05650 [Pseudomonadota bacterium]
MEEVIVDILVDNIMIFEGLRVQLLNGQGRFEMPNIPEVMMKLRPLLKRGTNVMLFEDGRKAKFFVILTPKITSLLITVEFFVYGWEI